jgi:hypothetical protein
MKNQTVLTDIANRPVARTEAFDEVTALVVASRAIECSRVVRARRG